MPNVILTYDIKEVPAGIHKTLKEYLIKIFGYSEYIMANSKKWYKLPNTTLVKENITSEKAAEEFVAACVIVKATYEKYIASEYTKCTFNSDVKLDKLPT